MHMVVLKQLVHMQRWEPVNQKCVWILLPLMKCAFEDIPQLVMQVRFASTNSVAQFVVQLSMASSAATAISAVVFAFSQVVGLGTTCAEMKDSVLTHLACRDLQRLPDARSVQRPADQDDGFTAELRSQSSDDVEASLGWRYWFCGCRAL